jgi:hypothetical protein
MCKLIKKIICTAVAALMLFIGITIWGNGGDKFRRIGAKTGGIIKKATDKLADESDNLSNKTKEKLKKWSGKKEEFKDK